MLSEGLLHKKRQPDRFPLVEENIVHVKAVLMEMTTKKWDIYFRKYMIHRLAA